MSTSVTKRKRTRTERKVRRRSDIITTAHRIFAKKGYHATSIADIAKALEIGHGTIYLYFKNKREVFEAVIDRLLLRVATAVELAEPPAFKNIDDYRTKFERVGAQLIRTASEPGAIDLLLRHARGVDSELNERMDLALEAMILPIERDLEYGIDQGYLNPDLDTHLTARALQAIVLASVEHSVRSKDLKETGAAWLNTMVQLTFNGIAGQ